MHTLSKDQVKNLDADQQETYGLMVAGKIKRQQRLRKLARGSRLQLIFLSLAVMGVLGFNLIVQPGQDSQFQISYPTFILLIFVAIQVGMLTQRLDAVVELMEEEQESTP